MKTESKSDKPGNKLLWIVIGSLITAVIGLAVLGVWNYFGDKILGKHPDIYVVGTNYIVEQGVKSQLEKGVQVSSNFRFTKVPAGETGLVWDPIIWWADLPYPHDKYRYVITIVNKGNGVAKNLIIQLYVNKNIINWIKIMGEENIDVIEGGVNTGFADFRIRDVFPGVYHYIFLTAGGEVSSLTAWSENGEPIEKIFLTEVNISSMPT
jgi:hypothetical protein